MEPQTPVTPAPVTPAPSAPAPTPPQPAPPQNIGPDGKKLWFRAKRVGWGWQPVSWQGWLITFVYIIGLAHFAWESSKQDVISDQFMHFGINFVILTIPLLVICYMKGEKLSWRRQS